MKKLILYAFLSFIFPLSFSQAHINSEQCNSSIFKQNETFSNGMFPLPKSNSAHLEPIPNPKPYYIHPQPMPFYENKSKNKEERIKARAEEAIKEELMKKREEIIQGKQ
ncbi:MAG: hypothetical protein ACQEV7_11425 [Bacillota bacterium]